MKKFITAITLVLSITAFASDNDVEVPLKVGDTIADMTVTQESINNVDRLIADIPMPKTSAELMTFQTTAMFNVFGEYCQRHKPALSQEMEEVVDDWTSVVSPKLNQSFSKYVNLGAPLSDKKRSELNLTVRNMSIMFYLDTEKNANPDQYCPALIQHLKTTDPDDFVYTVEKQYEAYMQRAK